MATKIRKTRSEPAFKSKSDRMRALFKKGLTVKAVAAQVGVGYAFAYGVAKRAGVADTAATRRRTRAVSIGEGGLVTIQTTIGPITVATDGTVSRPKVKRTKVLSAE